VNVPHFRRGTDDDRWVIPELVHQDMYRIGSLAEALRDLGGTILDCGAHIGVFSTLLAAHGVRQPIEAFEPEPDNYALLVKNVAPYPGITAQQVAVGRREEERVLFDGGETGRWSFVPPGDTNGRRGVRVRVIDLYEHIRELGEVALLKLDLEGFEAELLEHMPADVLARIHLLSTEEHHLPIDHKRLLAAGFEPWFQPRQDPRQRVYRAVRGLRKEPVTVSSEQRSSARGGRQVVVWRQSEGERSALVGQGWQTTCPAAVEMLPRDAVRILDLAGSEESPSSAAAVGDRVVESVVGDLERCEVSFATGRFDAIVLGRLFERVRDPARLLRRAKDWLRPGGSVVARLSNARHHAVLQRLLEGAWEGADPAGGLRIRFFTRREIEKLFFRAGLAVETLRGVPAAGERDRARGSGKVDLGHLRIQGLTPAAEDEFFASDYLVRATKRPEDDVGLTSIVVLTHDQLAYTRLCLESIRLFTDEPYEAIVVDNASTDGTVEYLRSLGGVTVIQNKTNRGFPAGANQEIRAARGRQILLLNNDTVVTSGWLAWMLRALREDPAVGLVGPCSNRVSGEEQIGVDYDEDLVGLDGFAWDWGRDNDGRREIADRLVGFCLLIRRQVIDEVGFLDERFGVGCFEDDDYCKRAVAAGYRAVIARDSFVHHFGGRTFVGSGVDFAALMRRNHTLFEEKWRTPAASAGTVRPVQAVRPDFPELLAFRRSPEGGLLLERKPISISLCMIVRDNARTIEACLTSIRPWVDEMCVVDTGSLDETPLIAARLGARVFHTPWRDSFSVARNESLRHARGRWIFWMDSDDTIGPENGQKLRDLVAHEPSPEILGFIIQVHCPGPGPDGGLDLTVVDHVKLFRNLTHLRFDGRIHEQILPAIRRSGGETAWTDVFVVHSGYDHSPEGQERKKQRDLGLLALELEDRPEHPFTLFNLGMTQADVGEYAPAADFLTRSIHRSGEGASHLRKAYALLIYCLNRLGNTAGARDACERGLRLFPEDAELRFRHAILLHQSGSLTEAIAAYLELLARPVDRYFSSIDRGILGFKARQNLALVYADRGDLALAEEQWRLIAREVPHYREGWRGLGDILLRQEKFGEVDALAGRLRADEALRAEGLMLVARMSAASGPHAQDRHPGSGQRGILERIPLPRGVTRVAPVIQFDHQYRL
jgi:O-antigen biosynthesis protein